MCDCVDSFFSFKLLTHVWPWIIVTERIEFQERAVVADGQFCFDLIYVRNSVACFGCVAEGRTTKSVWFFVVVLSR